MKKTVKNDLDKALEEKIRHLKDAYAKAEKDSDSLQAIKEWEILDTEDWE